MTALPEPASDPRQKAVLFCATCGHESPVDGDWIVRDDRGDREVYECPVCGATLTTRRSPAIPC